MTIELGELPMAGAEPDIDGPPHRIDRRTVRKVGLVLIALVCVLGVTGSTRPEPRGVRSLWSVPNIDGYGTTLTEDTLYVSHPVGSEVRMTAYELATGKARWSIRSDADPSVVDAPGVGLVLMPGDRRTVTVEEDNGVYTTEFATTTTAVDAHTGATRWTMPGDVMSVWGETALIADYTDRGALRRLRLLRLTDRTTIWTRDTPGLQAQGIGLDGRRPDRIVTVAGNGEVVVTRFSDGAPLAAGRIPWEAPRPSEGYWNEVIPMDDYLVVNRSQGERASVSIYRMDTMTRLWERRSTNGYPFPCGAAICINQGDRVVSYDAATGTERWGVSGGFNAWQPAEGRMVLEKSDGDGQRLIDADTGAQVGDPVKGNIIWNWQAQRSSALFLLEPTSSPEMRTAVTRWDLATGRTYLLGTIAHQYEYRCQTLDHYLACTNGGKVEVTAVG